MGHHTHGIELVDVVAFLAVLLQHHKGVSHGRSRAVGDAAADGASALAETVGLAAAHLLIVNLARIGVLEFALCRHTVLVELARLRCVVREVVARLRARHHVYLQVILIFLRT